MTPPLSERARSRLGWLATGLLPSAWVLLLFNLLSAKNEEMFGPRALPLEYAAGRSQDLFVELFTSSPLP